MTSTAFPRLPATALPVDAVLFAMNALVDPVAPGARRHAAAVPGVRRLVLALARAGLAPHALAVRHQSPGGRERHLAESAEHLAAAGLGPDVLHVVDADATLSGISRARTLVVTRCPEMAAGLSGAGHPVVVLSDDAVAHVVFRWLAGPGRLVRRRQPAGRPAGGRGRRRGRRPPAAPDQAAGFARATRAHRGPAGRHRRRVAAAAAPPRRHRGVRRRPRRARPGGVAVAPGGDRPDGGQLPRRRGRGERPRRPGGRRRRRGRRRRGRRRPRAATATSPRIGPTAPPRPRGLLRRTVRRGTSDLATGPAMTHRRGPPRPRRRRRGRRPPRRRRRPLPGHGRHGHRQHHALRRADRHAHRPAGRLGDGPGHRHRRRPAHPQDGAGGRGGRPGPLPARRRRAGRAGRGRRARARRSRRVHRGRGGAAGPRGRSTGSSPRRRCWWPAASCPASSSA